MPQTNTRVPVVTRVSQITATPANPAREAGKRRGALAVTLAVILPLARVGRLCAQDEDQLGYRHELYQEDNDRMRVRLTGSVVVDAISGATPTGAPPQSRWPFASYSTLFHTAYNQAYASQFSQFVSQNQIYVDAGYETYQQMTNSAAQYAQSTAGGIATNSANASYHTLTNNPNYHNNSVPLTHIHDQRTAFSLGLPMTFGNHEITPSIAYSIESDYVSWSGALNYSLSLNHKNTIVSTGWAHNADSVRDDLFVWEAKKTDAWFVGISQLLTPKAYINFNADFTTERGYLSDPYRGVMPAMNYPQLNPDDAALIPEKRPRHRNSEVFSAAYTQYIDPLEGSFDLNYRFFHDSYGIFTHTVGFDWNQRIGRHVVISPTFRYYIQNAASFYYVLVPDYNNLPNYYSSDYRLSELQTLTGGVTITWRIHKHLSLDFSYLRYVMQGLDGVTSQSAYPSANVFSGGLRLWF